ncbi:MAG: threonine--tRNA ligase [Firmicutes bacterium]|nr:threonine--tRNA ligase [Candidatus Colivicinus equi]
MINVKENEQLSIMNHSCAHLLAQAVTHLFPNAKFWVGPVIEEGFYYDMDLGDYAIKDDDLEKIEKEMKKIVKDGKRIVRKEISKDEALEMFKDDPYKIDLINNMEEGSIITTYTQGDFTDLCRGPHVETVKELKNFKLLKHSGAYWKGDANNKMLQRIYGICFPSQEELETHLNQIEEAKKRDHRKLGKEMGLFMMSDYGPGLPFWLPNGYVLRRTLEDFWLKLHAERGYQTIDTPIFLNRELWETSGHWDHYKDDMYTFDVEDGTYAIKPMNCPGAILVYNNALHSYKELPLRYSELGHVHRYEASGALSGLFRVRGFTQDDAHILLMESQIGDEVARILELYDYVYSIFGLNYAIELSTRPEDFIGEIEVWDAAEKALEKACLATGHKFKINPGDGAFYGPKLDFKLTDSLGRIWQCGTVQLDMQLPGRFNCTYIAEDGSKKTPVMIHRACFGSLERFIGILIENYGGVFPLWLAPKQVTIIPVNSEIHSEYANKVKQLLIEKGIKVEVDDRNEKLGYRMREAQLTKVPVVLVVGDNEMNSNTVNIRRHGKEGQQSMGVDELIESLQKEIEEKK